MTLQVTILTLVIGHVLNKAMSIELTADDTVWKSHSHRYLRGLSSIPQQNQSSLMFIAIIVSLICIFYLICTLHCLRLWLCRTVCRREVAARPDETVLVHEGRLFNLTGDQRRAVLEAIFSETSKAATFLDVGHRRRRLTRQPSLVPIDVEIPGISTAGTEASADTFPNTAENNSDRNTDKLSSELLDDSLELEDDTETPLHNDYDEDNIDQGSNTFAKLPPHKQTSPDELNGTTASPPLSPRSPSNSMVAANPMTPLYASILGTCRSSTDDEDKTPRRKCKAEDLAAGPNNSESTKEDNDLNIDTDASQSMDEGLIVAKEIIGMESLDNSQSISNMLSLPNLRTKKRASFMIPEETEAIEESKEEIDTVRGVETMDSADDDDDEDDNNNTALKLSVPFIRAESFQTVASEYTYHDDDSCTTATGDNTCAICLCGYKMGDMLIVSKYCTHVFHKDCILEWLQKHDECPVCRVNMVSDSDMSRAASSLVGKTRMYRAVAQTNRSNQTTMRHAAQQHHASPFEGTVRRVATQHYMLDR